MSLVPVVITFSRFASSLLVPLLYERFTLTMILYKAQIIKTLLFACLIIFTFFNFLTLVFVLISLISFLDGCTDPTSDSLIPRIVNKTELVKANSTATAFYQTIELSCWALGGMALVLVGVEALLLIVFILNAFSALFFKFLFHSVKTEKMKSEGKVTVYNQLLHGWRIIKKTPWLLAVAIITFIEAAVGVVWIAAILYLYVEEILNVSQSWWGWINTAFFVGLLLTGLLVYRLANWFQQQLTVTVFIGFCGSMIALAVFAGQSSPFFALIISLFVGIFTQLRSIGLETILQQHISANHLPYVYAAVGSIGTIAFGLGSLTVGLVAEWLGIRFVYLIGSILLIPCIVIWFFFVHMNKSLKSSN